MPLQKLQFRPGLMRDNTTLAGEGGWFECDKVRFRSGMPEKLGGWQQETPTLTETLPPPNNGSYWGICRWLFDWSTLAGAKLSAIGTNQKLYIECFNNATLYDITPIQTIVPAGDITLAAVDGSSIITMTISSGVVGSVGDFFTLSGAVGLGGNITATVLNKEFRVASIVSGTEMTFDCNVVADAADVGDGGALTTATFQLSISTDTLVTPSGWGGGGWGGIDDLNPTATPVPWGGGTVNLNSIQLRLWNGANYGESLIACPSYGPLYLWNPDPVDPYVFNPAVVLSSSSPSPYTTDTDCPSVVYRVMVSDSSRFVIAMGCTDYVVAGGEYDPMLVRWSDQENYTVWTPAITNQAGSFRLSKGSQIVSSIQTRQEILIWTDTAVYAMQYIGPPYVWSFNLLGDNTSIVSMNCTATASNIVYWMGFDKFYCYTGRVETLPCMLRQYVFGDINLTQSQQFFAGTNEGYHEIWWFYCSADSDTIDRYVIYNYMDKAWSYGTMARTAWLDTALRQHPTAAGYDGQILLHEYGTDDGTTVPASPIHAYIQSADIDIGDGDHYAFVNTIIPDLTFDGSTVETPEVTMTVRPRRNPGSSYGLAPSNPAIDSVNNYDSQRNYTVQRFTEFVYVRVRGRQMAFKIESNTLGVQWQLGVPRINIRPDGRRA